MADSKVTALTALTAPASGDLLYIVDVSDTTDDAAGSSRKITLSDLFKPYQVKDGQATGTQSTSGSTAITVNLDTEVYSNTNYSLSADTVTVTAAGKYWISWQVTINTAANLANTRDGFWAWVEVNSSQTNYEHLESMCYYREAAGLNSCGGSGLADLSASDVLRLRTKIEAGSDAWPLQQNRSWLAIFRVG